MIGGDKGGRMVSQEEGKRTWFDTRERQSGPTAEAWVRASFAGILTKLSSQRDSDSRQELIVEAVAEDEF